MAPRRKIDENMFTIAKALTLSEKTLPEIKTMTGLSTATLYRIRNSANYDAYRAIIMENAEQIKAKRKGVQNPPKTPENAPVRTPAHWCTPVHAPANTPARTPAKTSRTRTPAPAVASGGSSYYGNTRLVELMIQQNKLLESISNKLAFIVEQLA